MLRINRICCFHFKLPPRVKSPGLLAAGKLLPMYATVCAGLNKPVFPLLCTPFHTLVILGIGLNELHKKLVDLPQTETTMRLVNIALCPNKQTA